THTLVVENPRTKVHYEETITVRPDEATVILVPVPGVPAPTPAPTAPTEEPPAPAPEPAPVDEGKGTRGSHKR
ncbi:MAG: hypothetical protein KC621_19490, partial [Myxococcales bacterium]|nr:hypothetical protein [Myxococcales bacterium]